jgi:hypothetical protein
MRIGLSLSRCVLDIIKDQVSIDDVLVIIAGTHFDPTIEADWENIWISYALEGSWGEWYSAHHDEKFTEQKFKDIVLNLWYQGKIHQPRKFGSKTWYRKENWLEAILPPEELEKNQSAKLAWEKFRVVAGLANIKINNS